MAWLRVGSGLQAQVVNASDKATPGNVAQETTVLNTLVPRATLCCVAELHVASGMPQWRMFVTYCYF